MQSGIPCTKLDVPSIGSTIHRNWDGLFASLASWLVSVFSNDMRCQEEVDQVKESEEECIGSRFIFALTLALIRPRFHYVVVTIYS